jgi:2-haloacid dehalogenase
MPQHSTVVFDLGGVLIDWDPRHLYRKLFRDEATMEAFLGSVCTPAWNLQQDAGRPLAEACAVLVQSHPQHKEHIEAWGPRFDEMMAGPIAGTVQILAELCARGTPLYALSNWSEETFEYALRRFDFLQWFDGIVISGKLKVVKPDPRIYQHLLDTHALQPEKTVFIDDVSQNVAGAAALGIHGVLFTTPAALRKTLTELELL